MADPIVANRFYVYVHSRLSSGEPFYVGKGISRRAMNPINRSDHWKSIVKKDGGFYNTYVAHNLDEELSLLLEIELIDKYRRMGVKLINQTNGGDGTSGYRWAPNTKPKHKMTDEQRARMSAAQKARTIWPKLTEEHKKKISASMRGKQNALGYKPPDAVRAKWSAVRKGKQMTLGHVLSAEHKAKVSASLLGNKRSLGHKASDEAKRKLSVAQKAAWERRKALK